MIYTAICGEFDVPRTDVKCFTEIGCFQDNRMASRLFKTLSHLYFKETTVYVDGNITPLVDEQKLIEELLGDAEMALFKHPYRSNVVQEYRACRELKKESRGKIQAFYEWYGYDRLKSLPLYECGMIIRRNTPRVCLFNHIWWSLISRWSTRDQFTCPLAILESGVKVKAIAGNVRKHVMFSYRDHTPVKHEISI